MVGRIGIVAGTFAAALVLVPAAHAAPPVCQGGSFITPVNTVVSLSALTCTNLTGTPEIKFRTPASHGQLSGPPYSYTPAAGYYGPDTFTYYVVDAVNGQSNDATVNLLVDSAPTCQNLSVATEFNTPLRIVELPCTDVDDADFDIFFDDPAHGTADVDPATGDVIYTPPAGFVGADTFPFYGIDRWGFDSPDSTVTVTVKPAPTPTVAPVVPKATPVPAPPPDKTPPNATLKVAGKPSLAKGVTVTLTSNEPATATLTLTVDRATARKFKLDKKAKGPVTIGAGTATLGAGAKNATVKLSAKARKNLKKAPRVKLLLTVVASDAAGNKATKTLAVTIKN